MWMRTGGGDCGEPPTGTDHMIESLVECGVRTKARRSPDLPVRYTVLEVRCFEGIRDTPAMRTTEPHEVVAVRTRTLRRGTGGIVPMLRLH